MEQFKSVIKWGGVAVGLALSAFGIVSQAKEAHTWGLSSWAWIAIGWTITVGVLLYVMYGFWSENRKLKKGQSPQEESIKEIEWRKEYRQPQLPEVTQIPPTLQEIWGLAANILEEKKKRKCSNEKLLEVTIDMLGIDRNDPILDVRNYTSEQKMRKSWKLIGARVGPKNKGERPKFLARWRRLLPEIPDKHGIGLMLKHSSEYTTLEQQIKDMGASITKTVIYQNIDRFLEDLAALYNLRLLLFYSKASEHINMFPRELREPMRYLEDNIERQMRSELVRVKANLEDYSIGKEPKDGE